MTTKRLGARRAARPTVGRNAPLRAITYKVASVLIYLVMFTLLKASKDIPAGELVFFRSLFGILPVLIFLSINSELRAGLQTKRLGQQIWRGLVGASSLLLNFVSLILLPLPESVTLAYMMPLVVVILSAIFLNEQVHLYRWTAVVVGLIGVVIIAWPRFTVLQAGVGSAAAIGVAAAIASACTGGAAQILVRRLLETERSATVILYFLATSAIVSLFTAPFGWVMPNGFVGAYLIGAGICGGIAQILLTESYRHADLSVTAPFEYTSLVFSLVIGIALFGDEPTMFMVVGAIVVVVSSLFIIYREHRLGLRGDRHREPTI